MASTIFYILGVTFALMCVFLMLLILIQKGRGGGLSSAFGGAGGNTAFGTKTGDVLTWATSVGFALFLLLAMGLVWTGNAVQANNAAAVGGITGVDGGQDDGNAGTDGEGESSLPDAPSTPEPALNRDQDGTAEKEPVDLNDVMQGENGKSENVTGDQAAPPEAPADSE